MSTLYGRGGGGAACEDLPALDLDERDEVAAERLEPCRRHTRVQRQSSRRRGTHAAAVRAVPSGCWLSSCRKRANMRTRGDCAS